MTVVLCGNAGKPWAAPDCELRFHRTTDGLCPPCRKLETERNLARKPVCQVCGGPAKVGAYTTRILCESCSAVEVIAAVARYGD